MSCLSTASFRSVKDVSVFKTQVLRETDTIHSTSLEWRIKTCYCQNKWHRQVFKIIISIPNIAIIKIRLIPDTWRVLSRVDHSVHRSSSHYRFSSHKLELSETKEKHVTKDTFTLMESRTCQSLRCSVFLLTLHHPPPKKLKQKIMVALL